MKYDWQQIAFYGAWDNFLLRIKAKEDEGYEVYQFITHTYGDATDIGGDIHCIMRKPR